MESKTSGASRLKTIVATNIGAVLEWYDLALYGFFAVVFAKQFFPSHDENTSILLSLGAFALSWFVRPLGAVILGAYTDRKGRKPGLVLSAGLMMIGTLILTLAPTYEKIGILAPILVLLARSVQGFSAGGEFGAATAMLAEQDPSRRGYYASLQWSATGIAITLAAIAAYLVNVLLPAEAADSWGWRLPFGFGLLIGPVAVYIRRHLDEPEEYKAAKTAEQPVREVIANDKLALLLGAGFVAAGACGSYLNSYMPTFAITKLNLPASSAMVGTIAAGLINTFMSPVFGDLSDKIGRYRVMAILGTIGLILIYPLFVWLVASPSVFTLVAIQSVVALVFYSGYYAAVPSALADLFPTRRRTTGVSLAYVLAQTIFGGVTPLVVAWIVARTGDSTSPALYLGAVMILSLGSVFFAHRLQLKSRVEGANLSGDTERVQLR